MGDETKDVTEQAEELTREQVMSMTINVYNDGSIDCQTDPPTNKYAVLGIIATIQRQLGG